MLVLIGLCRELNELRLLLLGECVALWLFPSMALFNICHYAVRRVAADISVTNCGSKHRMQNGIYYFHTVRLEPSVVDQGNIELLYIAILYCSDVNSDDVIIDQNGDCYLAGPGIIFALEDGDIVSLDEEDKKLITQVLEDGTAELTNGAEIRCAFGL